ncbi:MAG: saccharopine dehydrogenase NADP-binding domain-containing protein [Alcanivorax sp.]|nr:saccharopine dehydrogenase NADP-binding domain-containing protein [Alcanivorax sp.]
MSTAQFDLVVFGATSFVGQILVRYLTDTFGTDGDLKWALAGRSREKLEQVRSDLGSQAVSLPVIVADAADEDSLRQLCQQTRVVVSTVGPYALYGEPLVKVCADTGTHYCDLTGEVQWIPRMISRYEAAAKASGARIVHCCGFDSIPSDFGVFFLQQQAQARFGAPCTDVKMRVKAAKGGASGGTVASMMNVAREAASDSALRKQLSNPYALCPPDHGFTVRQANVSTPTFDADFDAWAGPFVMAGINTRIVHRSNALLGNAYGDDFRYDEAMLTGKGFAGRMKALGLTTGTGAFLAAAALAPSRWVLEKFVVPKPGEGPTPAAQKAGFYDLRFVGKTDSGARLQVRVTGAGDPGYGSTAKLLGQAAASLAKDIADDVPGGFWTPASLMGNALLSRLSSAADLTFEVQE